MKQFIGKILNKSTIILENIKLLFVVNNEKLRISDVIVCLEGDNNLRVDKSYELFLKGLAPIILVSGGLENYPGSIHARDMKNYLVGKGVSEDRIYLEENSQNTYGQAREVMKIIREKNWGKVILVASEFHQLRAFLTFLKERGDYPVIILNAPSKKSWFNKSLGIIRWKLLVGELKKIKEYKKKGHLASIKEAINYQKWKEQQN